MSGGLRFCRDCRWIGLPVAGDYTMAICRHPTSLYQHELDLVSGETPKPEQVQCRILRMGMVRGHNRCGFAGKHWEPAVTPGFV